MATQSATNDTTARSTSTKPDEGVAQTVRNVADSVAGAAGDVSARVPEVAQSTREAFTEATRMVQRGSDQTLRVVGAASIGFAAGLLVGGANRLLVIASLIPAALIGATMVERTDGGTDATRSRSARV